MKSPLRWPALHAVFTRIWRRRALKRALCEEASRLQGELEEIRRIMCPEARRAGVDLDRLSSSAPSCPTCGERW